jgi:hypothetical protein
MAADSLTGNIATEDIELYANTNKIDLGLNTAELQKSYKDSWEVFNQYH